MPLPDGRVLWHKVDPAEGRDGKDWHQVELHAADAAHALETDGKDGYHWKVEKPEPEIMPEAESEIEVPGEEESHEEVEQ
ncbi:hypothetical protein IVB43_23850 [Bradyrhizobium sp. 48]|uniref:hypothetical protein n=1 Tax=Bradyrhizobium sp. 48 TaxID=2782676 RepID=UPI001FF844C8|nr:hypothetical protein [Bradyrhizobium sp. 48]MCK1445423.1 hypothetical protein [Bradyrhizobium sp. 48]